MKGRIGRKLKSCAGESIGETLIALLISSLALVMLAGAISTATRVIQTSKNKMDNYYLQDGNVAKRDPDQVTNKVGESGLESVLLTVTLKHAEATEDEIKQEILGIPCYQNTAFGSAVVYSYAAPTPAPGGEEP